MISGLNKSVIILVEIVACWQLLLHRGSTQVLKSSASLLIVVAFLHLSRFGAPIFRVYFNADQCVDLGVLTSIACVYFVEKFINFDILICKFMLVMLEFLG
jgi:hypothetical protein